MNRPRGEGLRGRTATRVAPPDGRAIDRTGAPLHLGAGGLTEARARHREGPPPCESGAVIGYPPRFRVTRAADYRLLQQHGDVFPGREVVVRRRPNGLSHPRLGIAAPRRFGRSVRRNRFRRLVREAFRAVADRLGAVDLLVAPKRTLEEPTIEGIRDDLVRTISARPAPARPTRR